MEKKIKDAIEKVIHLAYNYRRSGNISPVNLLKESGYLDFPDQINESQIEEILKLHPNLINEWLLWSENKRTSDPVWTFAKFDDGTYSVGYPATSNKSESEDINTKDEFYACAIFIKREAEYLRGFITK